MEAGVANATGVGDEEARYKWEGPAKLPSNMVVGERLRSMVPLCLRLILGRTVVAVSGGSGL